jgi:protein TonB
LLFNVQNRFRRLLRIADARGPRSTIALVLALALWSVSITWLVHGLSGAVDTSPRPVALDVHIVQLAPPPPPPPPPPVQHVSAAPAAPAITPKPVHALVRHVAPPQQPKVAAVPPPLHTETQQHANLPASPPPETQAHTGNADLPAKSAPAGTDTTATNTGAAGNGPAHAIFQPLPELPDDLREDALQAVAMARFSIRADGSVEVELTSPTHVPRLNQLLLDALKKWRFFPAMKNGQPIASSQDIRVHFNVD